MCCDCCVDAYPGNDVYGNTSERCYGCPDDAGCYNPVAWYKCICHAQVATC